MSVFANAIAPTAYFWPGVLPMMLGLAMPATVLAAIIERPFVTRAGVTRHALWYSFQANFLSLLIGYATMPCAVQAIFDIGPLWSLIAITISIVSEGVYYQQRWVPGEELKWGWVAVANIISSVVLLLLPSIALSIKSGKPDLERGLDPYQDVLFWGSVVGSVLIFVLSFFMPRILRRRTKAHEAPEPLQVTIAQ
ncbi:MAG TPA: hypothetical protein VGX70_18000 [Gemmataceae bacterium]|jgi:hypothetical protein|nr:hypothetical protein [Gemmataceae bacterium]